MNSAFSSKLSKPWVRFARQWAPAQRDFYRKPFRPLFTKLSLGLAFLLGGLLLIPATGNAQQKDSAVSGPNNLARIQPEVIENTGKNDRVFPPLPQDCADTLSAGFRRQCHQEFIKNYLGQGLYLSPQLAARVPSGQVMAVVSVDTLGRVHRIEASRFGGDLVFLDQERQQAIRKAVKEFLGHIPPYRQPALLEGEPVPFRFGVQVTIREDSRP